MSEFPQIPLQPGEQYRFHFDMGKCIGCKCCEVACHEQNNNPPDVKWRSVGELEGGEFPHTTRLYVSMACNHCVEPTCLSGCPVDAYYKDPTTGAVRMKDDACIGCGYCTWNCPYEAPQMNPERGMVTKCDFCHNRLTDGLLPACVQACPSDAIEIERVHIEEWVQDLADANAPGVPDASITLSTTRISVPTKKKEDLNRIDDYRLKPEKPHYALNGMTILTQLSVGGFLALFFAELVAHFSTTTPVLQKYLQLAPAAMLGTALLALVTSAFHLGRPLFAFRALKMWRRSWLSREVLFFSVFAVLASAYAGLGWIGSPLPTNLMASLGALVALTGIAGIYSSAKIYMVPARPSWNNLRTPVAFFATALFLGPLTGLFLFTTQVKQFVPALLEGSTGLVILGLIGMTVLAAFLQLGSILIKVFHILNQDALELQGTAKLLTQRFRNFFLFRLGSLIATIVGIPLTVLAFSPAIGSRDLSYWFAALLILALISESAGRHLFYVTVVPQKRPGGYFQ